MKLFRFPFLCLLLRSLRVWRIEVFFPSIQDVNDDDMANSTEMDTNPYLEHCWSAVANVHRRHSSSGSDESGTISSQFLKLVSLVGHKHNHRTKDERIQPPHKR